MKNKWIPQYAVIPMLAMAAMNMIAYFGTRIFTTNLHHYNLSIGLDHMIPFLPIFILPYILAYLQWLLGYIAIGREGKKHCYTFMTAEIIAKIFACITFIVLPTTLIRPNIISTDIFSRLTALIYKLDAADNLFPSIHCLESYVCLRGIWKSRRIPTLWQVICLIMTVLVFMSIVFVKQHVLVDMVGAVIYYEIALIISRRIYAAY